MRLVKRKLRAILDRYPKWLCEREFGFQKFERYTERAVEYAFVFSAISRYYPLRVLDVGTGTTALPFMIRNCGCLVTAIDNIKDYWPEGAVNRHYHVLNDDITATKLTGAYDLVTCISVLEHIQDSSNAVKNMFSLMAPNGHLILTFPYNERRYVRNVYEMPDSTFDRRVPYITQAYSRTEIDRWICDNNAEIVQQEYWKFWDGEYWTGGNIVIPPMKVGADEPHQLSCVLLRKRSS